MHHFACTLRRLAGLSAAALALAPGLAWSQSGDENRDASAVTVSGTATLTSDYLFRGLTQTGGKPAVQAGVELGGKAGFYAGSSGSNVGWLQDYQGYRAGSLELDLYGGWRFKPDEATTFDVGLIHYRYPGSRPAGVVRADTTELLVGAAWRQLAAKLYVSAGDTFGFDAPAGSTYLDLSAAVPIGDGPWTIDLHAGRQRFRGAAGPFSYTDWKLGVRYDASTIGPAWNGTTVSLQYTDTNADRALWTDLNGVNMGRARLSVILTRSF
ncbi:MAG: TorF family putative porin [Pseudomonadota bacterium]|jgi:uncharacterized protein (TIGR02001 family)|uniref:Uncharacterized protein (TIGR02001 family) n=2 Tax=Burkholderiales TaxID=80840 RepID=A0AA46DCD3_9BURK|nr:MULTISPECIES: TorF family putative porin [Burkholderiales]TCP06545.1 uncharacterized protein (TIGR02001 family) [Caldimonas thermodepolymerans]TSE21916.1 hypothetical protein Taqua_02234 [Tepidimonas aquatica]UZG49398.1 TorF family putative porin [Caldimonas thermodepolymerans]